jgi:hypothetical protein
MSLSAAGWLISLGSAHGGAALSYPSRPWTGGAGLVAPTVNTTSSRLVRRDFADQLNYAYRGQAGLLVPFLLHRLVWRSAAVHDPAICRTAGRTAISFTTRHALWREHWPQVGSRARRAGIERDLFQLSEPMHEQGVRRCHASPAKGHR